MSDPVKCDLCESVGRRRMGCYAPEGWLWFETIDEDDPANSLIVFACSRYCATNIWKPGPGKLELGSQQTSEEAKEGNGR